MAHKINRSGSKEVSLQKVQILKEKISDPKYINEAITWIANHLASRISTKNKH